LLKCQYQLSIPVNFVLESKASALGIWGTLPKLKLWTPNKYEFVLESKASALGIWGTLPKLKLWTPNKYEITT